MTCTLELVVIKIKKNRKIDIFFLTNPDEKIKPISTVKRFFFKYPTKRSFEQYILCLLFEAYFWSWLWFFLSFKDKELMRNLLLRNTFRGKCLFVIAKTTCALLHFRRTQSCLCLYFDNVGGSRRELQTDSPLLNTVFFVIQRRKHCHTLN